MNLKNKIAYLENSEKYILDVLQIICSKYEDNRDSLVYFFSHEIIYFFLTWETKKHLNILDIEKNKYKIVNSNFKFAHRRGRNVFIKTQPFYKRFLNKFISTFFLILNFKFVLIGNQQFSRQQYLKLFFRYGLIPDYSICQSNIKIRINNIEEQKKELLELIDTLVKKFEVPKNLSIVIYTEIGLIIDNFFELKTNKKLFSPFLIFEKVLNKSHSAIIGSPVNIYNRHLAFLCHQNSIRVTGILHHGEAGLTDQGFTAVDDWGTSDDLIGYGMEGCKPTTWSKYIPKWSKIKYHCIKKYENMTSISSIEKKFSNVYDLLTKGRGLYLESRIQFEFSICSTSAAYNPIDEINWRDKILSKYSKLDIKIHPKGVNTIKQKHSARQVNGSLYELAQKYDYLMFDNCGSSAFTKVYYCRCPIILIDRTFGSIYSKKGLKFIKQRCEYFSDRNIFLNSSAKEKLSKSFIKGSINKNGFVINNSLNKQWELITSLYDGKYFNEK